MKNNWSVLVKPTNDCNLNCLYCFDKGMREKYKGCKMTYEQIEHIAKLASDYANEVHWIWHGGEPTLMGVDWYKRAQEIFYKHYKTKWIQSMQTNGTLIDSQEWMDFFKNYSIICGTSFDGMFQYIRKGGEKVDILNIIKKFHENKISIGPITIINNENYKNQIDLYEMYKKEVPFITPAFNYIYKSEVATKNNLIMTDVDDYAAEFEKFYKHWLFDTDYNAIKERTCLKVTSTVFGLESTLCEETDCRQYWMGINSNGDIYPCDRSFAPQYFMGNIFDYKSIEEAYESEGFKNYFVDIEKRFENICSKCEYFRYCNGGCNANHVAAKGVASEIDEEYCSLYMKKFDIVFNVLADVDVYKQKLNPNFIKLLLKESNVTLKEIIEYLRVKGYKIKKSQENKKNFDRFDFKLYNIFNPRKRKNIDKKCGHIDCFDHKVAISVNVDNDFDFNSIKKERQMLLELIYNSYKENIDLLFSKGC